MNDSVPVKAAFEVYVTELPLFSTEPLASGATAETVSGSPFASVSLLRTWIVTAAPEVVIAASGSATGGKLATVLPPPTVHARFTGSMGRSASAGGSAGKPRRVASPLKLK